MNDPHDPAADGSRLEAIPTRPSLVQAAHQESALAGAARNALVLRYRKAIRAYLGRLLPNDADAEEVAQDLMVKLLTGEFARAVPERGRFRDYLKTAVRNSALNRLRQRTSARRAALDPACLEGPAALEEAWLADWRRTLLDGARQSLHSYQAQRPGNVYATLLDRLGTFPDDDSAQLAHRLELATGQPYRADAVRQLLSRARRKLAWFLLEEVRHTLAAPSPVQLEEELTELGLLSFIQAFLPADWRES
jgi:RNA polymerase sigma factor (sigma-70 family)